MSKKGRSKGEKPEVEMDAVQMANEELRAKLTSIQIEFQQEKSKGLLAAVGRLGELEFGCDLCGDGGNNAGLWEPSRGPHPVGEAFRVSWRMEGRRIPSGGDSSLAPAEHWPWGQVPGGEAWLCPLAAPHPRQVTGASLMLGCLVAKQLPPSWRCESFMWWWWWGGHRSPQPGQESHSAVRAPPPLPLSTSTCSASSNSRVQGMGTGNVFLVYNLFCSDETNDLCGAYFVTDKLSFLVGKLRERLQEAKLEREQEQRRHTAYISELRAKLHEEKTKELQALREVLIRQHEQEAARTAKIKEGELQRLQATLNVLRDGAADKVKTALLAEAREEARRAFDGERLRLQQEILELKAARKQAEEALSNCMQADKTKAADLRAAYQAHQDEVHRIKRECERDIRRLMDEIKGKDRVILALEKELGVQTGQTQKLLLQKEALDEQLVQVREAERYHGSPKRELPPGIGDMAELMGVQDQHMDERDVRRFQLKIAELNSVIRKLEDRNTLLADERNELLKRSRETEVQLKPLVEKNKRMNKKNEDLLQSIQRMEEKIKNLTRENVEMKEKLSAQASLKRHTSLNDLSLTRDEQEIEFLRLQVLEQQHVIDDLSLVCLHEHERQPSVGRHETQALGMASGLQGDAAGGVGPHRAPPGERTALALQKTSWEGPEAAQGERAMAQLPCFGSMPGSAGRMVQA
ncbi:hypothetical protein J1605_011579 [Eschrichtius robustus]|uniref:Janus kinase and microtubule-interacting protein 1 n=1 Tax=Eschrichtius robustus TaxID=9764 RepID=A0AB34GPF1_ESCRO|nr:hypothetical protein J1605_011579 [Eschrichtius robustus]